MEMDRGIVITNTRIGYEIPYVAYNKRPKRGTNLTPKKKKRK